MVSVIDRARAYLSKLPPAISGQGGHNATYTAASSLVHGFALSDADAWALLNEWNRTSCQPPWSERELRHKFDEAKNKPHNMPHGSLRGSSRVKMPSWKKPASKPQPTPKPATEKAQPVADLCHADLPEPIEDSTRRLIETAFRPGEIVSIGQATLNDEGRCVPKNAGVTLTREAWLDKLSEVDGNPNRIFSSTDRPGAYIRINPMNEGGSGDNDVTAFRHVLVESDSGTLPEQLKTIEALGFPCTAVIYSGDKSIHAWVRVDAANRKEWEDRRDLIFSKVAGCDPKNKNPSRFSRLPGMIRGDRHQDLLAVNIGAKDWQSWIDNQEDPRVEILRQRQFNPAIEPPKLIPVFSLAKTAVSHTGNVTTINAAAKVGKTAVIEAAIASVFAGDNGSDCLGWESSNPDGKALLHFDTEQAPEDHWCVADRAARRSGVSVPPWFLSWSFAGMNATEAWELVQFAIEHYGKYFKGVHSVLIDGVADLVKDVNDSEESNAFVAQLHGLAIKHACPIIGVIHFNPGSEKTRGHLGSQLERKSESNLTLEKDGEVTTIYSIKQRRAPILKSDGPRFRWSEEAKMHVSCPGEKSEREKIQMESAKDECSDVFGERNAMRYTDIVVECKTVLDLRERSAKDRIGKWIKMGIIRKTVANLYEKAS